jgi:Cdc6-like AAA superfamily ATPase
MSRALLRKAYKAFSTSVTDRIYLRKKEMEEIEEFLESQRDILHICGNPGTGKTCVTLGAIRRPFLYINYLNEPRVNERVLRNRGAVVVIDEFDRYYRERRSECLQCMVHLREKGAKLITLSNDLRLASDALFFKPYSAEEMGKILEEKIENEVQRDFVSRTAIMLLAKKFEASGDLRLLFKCLQEVIENKIASGDEAGIVPADIARSKEGSREENNVHHEIVTRLMSRHKSASKMKVYSEYLRECNELGIASYDRVDFGTVFDIYY